MSRFDMANAEIIPLLPVQPDGISGKYSFGGANTLEHAVKYVRAFTGW
ncbi:MAG: hypothetical protein Tsb009_14880 [Planctomycetaceae bacterium]